MTAAPKTPEAVAAWEFHREELEAAVAFLAEDKDATAHQHAARAKEALAFVDAALREARAAAIEEAVPSGYVVVPEEPTKAMLEAVAPFPEHLAEEHRDHPEWRTQMTAATVADQMVARQTYRGMIAAAIRALGEESAAPREPATS